MNESFYICSWCDKLQGHTKTHPSHLNTHSHTFMINPTPPLQAIMKGQQRKPLSKLAYEEAMTYPTFNLLLEESLKPPSHLAIPYPMP